MYGGDDGLCEAPQPFTLRVHPDAAFLCDLHAHLCDAEIIGLLGGRRDPANNAVHVQAPFPCKAVPRDDDGATDVEMDPVSDFQVREVIRAQDIEVVGWYHSHPRFASASTNARRTPSEGASRTSLRAAVSSTAPKRGPLRCGES